MMNIGGKDLRISEIFVLILHITAICIQAQTANFFTRLFTFYNMTFATVLPFLRKFPDTQEILS